MARKGQTDPNAPVPGERRGLRDDAPAPIIDDEATRAEDGPLAINDEATRALDEPAHDAPERDAPEPIAADATQAQPALSMFDVPTRGFMIPQEQTPIEAPPDASDDEPVPVEQPFEASNPVPAPDPDELLAAHNADADDEEEAPIERTTIDSNLLEELARTREAAPISDLGDKTASLMPSADVQADIARLTDDSSKSKSRKRRPTALEDVASATGDVSASAARAVAPFEKLESGTAGATNPNDKPGSTVILEGDQHRKMLEARKNGGAPLAADELPSEQKTSARPLQPASYSGDGLSGKSVKSGSVTGDIPKEDDWGDYQEPADDWIGGGDSVSDVKPSKPADGISDKRTPLLDADSAVFVKRDGQVDIAVKLVALEGEDQGEIDLPSEDVTFGREADCPVVLKDPSISRRHARLTRVENGWELVDLKSGNGTFVNDKRVDRAIVRHNDEIKLGSALFRFVDPSEGMRPVDASAAPVLAASSRAPLLAHLRDNPRLRTVVVVAGVICVVSLLTLAVMAMQKGGGGKARTEVFQLYLQGVEQFKQHRWVPAEGFFAAALQRDHEHQRSRRYLEAIAVEKRAEAALSNAKLRLSNGDLAAAYENAIQASDSVFFGQEAQAVIRDVDRLADERLAKAKNAIAGDDKIAAQHLLEGLEFYSAYRADLNELRRQASLPAVSSKKSNILTEFQQPTSRGAAARGPTADALDALADGRVDEATIKLKALGENRDAVDVLEKLGKFNQLYTDGKSELGLKRAEGAIKMLTLAVVSLEQMVGQRGDFVRRVRNQLADALYLRAVGEYNAGKVEEAEKTAKMATTYFANHESSVNLLTKIQTEKK